MKTNGTLPGMIGRHPEMLRVYDLVRTVAPLDIPVLIVGETGTGKELVARSLHSLSNRARDRLVDVNCAAIPEHLCEGEMFGWEKGAFSGAERQTRGLMETADRGTLFLDEICSMPVHLQAKLLRAVEHREFRRVGGRQVLKSDFRMVAAVSRPLPVLIATGAMREDMAYRLAGVLVELPPLRKRVDDVPLLVEFFLGQITGGNGNCPVVESEAMNLLQRHRWPGNVRELGSLVSRLVLTARKRTISAAMVAGELGLGGVVAETAESLKAHLEAHGWDVSRAAKAIGLPRSTLRNRMRVLGVSKPVPTT